MFRSIAALLCLAACASSPSASFSDRFSDITSAQRRLDARGIGFGVGRVPGHDAFVLQVRFRTSDANEAAEMDDPMEAAQAIAPPGCTVTRVTLQEDGLSYRADYQC